MTLEVVGSCQGETRMSEHVGISPAEEGWTVANDNETCLVVALNCYVLQHSPPPASSTARPTTAQQVIHRTPQTLETRKTTRDHLP
jgi:hypothetical protein